MLLQFGGDRGKLVVDLGHLLLELGDVAGGADAGHHVLALGVDEVLAEQVLFAGGGVAGKGHAGAGGTAEIAEDHGLHIDGGAPVIGDLIHAAVDIGAVIIPGAEDGLYRLHELLLGVLGEVLALLGLVEGLEALHQGLHILGIQINVVYDSLFGLDVVDDLLKAALGELHHHIGEHLDKAAVGVVGKAGIFGFFSQPHNDAVVEPQVQDGVHHAGHGGAGAGAHRNQQRIGDVAKLLSGGRLQLGEIFQDLGLDLRGDGTAIRIITSAGLGGHGKALGHRHTEIGHLSQVGALAAQQLTHVAVAFTELINIFMAHVTFLLKALTL